MTYQTIIVERERNIPVLTFNRPDKRNALSLALLREVSQVLTQSAADDTVKVVVITGGPACFSAGGDLTEKPRTYEMVQERRAIYAQVRNFEKPLIAVIRGWCMAGGLEVAMACDIRVAADTARISERHTQIGVIGGGGSPALLPRLVGLGKASELVFTSDTIDGPEALRIGLVNRVFPDEICFSEALKIAGKIDQKPLHVLKLAKKALTMGMNTGLAEAVRLSDTFADAAGAAKVTPEVEAFLNKRV
ncbi:MAG: enoyl-CoA hydratase/isomerase family protein [Chloroflexi bacterium]|nr:enoyl-CoA hydratase/isomerase family protein [Chloroflexota bacterium]